VSRVLRDRGIVAWALAAGVSQLGDAIWFVALAWTAVQLDGPGLAGAVMAASALPRAALILAGGALTDRLDAWRLMVGADVARVLVLAAGLLSLQAAEPTAALLIALGVCFGVADAVYAPASGAFPRRLVGPEDLLAVAGLRQLVARGALLAGAPLGGAIVAAGGIEAAMLVDLASFAVVAVVLLRVRPRRPLARAAGHSLLADVRGGLAYVRGTPRVRTLVLAFSGLNVFVTPVVAVGLALRVEDEHWGAARLGVLTGCIGAGAAVGTLLTLRLRLGGAIETPLLLLLVQAAALAVAGAASYPGAVAATLGVGVTAGLASPLLEAAFQRTVAEDYLGRCGALVNLADAALVPPALVAFGVLAGSVGVAGACAASAGAFALLLAYAIGRTTRQPEPVAGT
jgi:hypothetical protein